MSLSQVPVEILTDIFNRLIKYDPPSIHENWTTKTCGGCGVEEIRLWVVPTGDNFQDMCKAMGHNRNTSDVRPLLQVNRATRNAAQVTMNQQDTRSQKVFYVTTTWFEDAVRSVFKLTGSGLRNITTLQIKWDNQPRATIQYPAPRSYADEVAAELFDTIRTACLNLRHLIISVDADSLVENHADGHERHSRTTMHEIIGIRELRRLMSELQSRGRSPSLVRPHTA